MSFVYRVIGIEILCLLMMNGFITGRSIVSYKNILIPLGKESKDLKALHHALSLAERIDSRVLVLSHEEATKKQKKKNPV
ncbi:MAG: hypothetical protein GY705_14820, partial [Bacteroidetes bacterium]|nr:hypothetical protein [Bacteroidota bacterium]